MALVPVPNNAAVLPVDGDNVECSSTDLARAWESGALLRRRAQSHQLVA